MSSHVEKNVHVNLLGFPPEEREVANHPDQHVSRQIEPALLFFRFFYMKVHAFCFNLVSLFTSTCLSPSFPRETVEEGWQTAQTSTPRLLIESLVGCLFFRSSGRPIL